MTTEIIEVTPVEPKKPKLSRGQKIDLLIMSPILIILLLAGVCRAYDMIMLRMLETNLANNVTAVQFTGKACESAYQALKKYKEENKIKLEGTGNPCEVF